jgi:hypothetical protein
MERSGCRLSDIVWKGLSKYKNKIEKVYSLENTDIPEIFFTPHHVGNCFNNVIQGHCCATMTLGHSCISVAAGIVNAHGCPGLVANAGQSPLNNNFCRPGKQASWARVVKPQRLNNISRLGLGVVAVT